MSNRWYIGAVLYNNTHFQIRRLIGSIVHQRQGLRPVTVGLRANDGRNYLEIIDNIKREFSTILEGVTIELSAGSNVGFGAAHNILANSAAKQSCDLYMGANPDGMFHQNAFSNLNVAVERHGAANLFELRQFPQEHPKTYDPVTGETAWCSGAAFAIGTELFMRLGGFDERIFMYCEDVDMSWRVRFDGKKCLLVHNSLFFHDLSDERDRYDVRIQMLQSGRYLAWKWKSDGFREIMETELVRLGIADAQSTLPRITGEQVTHSDARIHEICEFRRLFSFSSTRW